MVQLLSSDTSCRLQNLNHNHIDCPSMDEPIYLLSLLVLYSSTAGITGQCLLSLKNPCFSVLDTGVIHVYHDHEDKTPPPTHTVSKCRDSIRAWPGGNWVIQNSTLDINLQTETYFGVRHATKQPRLFFVATSTSTVSTTSNCFVGAASVTACTKRRRAIISNWGEIHRLREMRMWVNNNIMVDSSFDLLIT